MTEPLSIEEKIDAFHNFIFAWAFRYYLEADCSRSTVNFKDINDIKFATPTTGDFSE